MTESPYMKAYRAGVKLAHAEYNQEKTALLSRLLKPISNSYQGRALADRVAPLGWRRIGSELGHLVGDLGTGAGAAALAGADEATMAGAAALSAALGKQLNQVRANKYLNKALSGPNKLSTKDLKYLRGEMGDLSTYVGADSLHELFGGMSARRRVDDAIKQRLF
jgi:hypothetical protein